MPDRLLIPAALLCIAALGLSFVGGAASTVLVLVTLLVAPGLVAVALVLRRSADGVTPLTYLSRIEASPSWFPIILVLSFAVMAYSAFVAVAIWRSAGRYSGASAWRFLARGSVLFVAVQVVVGMSLR